MLSAQHRSVLEENQRLRAKLENLEQVLKVTAYTNTSCDCPAYIFFLCKNTFVCVCMRPQHMREVAERRQQLELEHEQALAILKFKQDEIKRLQRVGHTLPSYCFSFKGIVHPSTHPHVFPNRYGFIFLQDTQENIRF